MKYCNRVEKTNFPRTISNVFQMFAFWNQFLWIDDRHTHSCEKLSKILKNGIFAWKMVKIYEIYWVQTFFVSKTSMNFVIFRDSTFHQFWLYFAQNQVFLICVEDLEDCPIFFYRILRYVERFVYHMQYLRFLLFLFFFFLGKNDGNSKRIAIRNSIKFNGIEKQAFSLSHARTPYKRCR